jgi:hypothetical protein
MKESVFKKTTGIFVVFTLLFVFLTTAHADSLTLNLNSNSLIGVDDTAGGWLYEGGTVYLNATYIGDYAITRRTIKGGTDAQKTAMLTMTIFLLGTNPPQNLTLQGSHSFDNGVYIGSISAASGNLASLVGATFSGKAGTTGTLTITY